MRLRDFIKANRVDLSMYIALRTNRERPSISDIAEWINNDESLYNWARSEGVRI